MKRLSLYISIVCLSSLLLSLAVPEVSVRNHAESEIQEQDKKDKSDQPQTFEISTSSEAILTLFQFDASSVLSLVPKLHLVFQNELANSSFADKDFVIVIWKKIFTKIIQIHGP